MINGVWGDVRYVRYGLRLGSKPLSYTKEPCRNMDCGHGANAIIKSDETSTLFFIYGMLAHRRNHSDRVLFSPGVAGGASLFISSTTELTVAYTCGNLTRVKKGGGSKRAWFP